MSEGTIQRSVIISDNGRFRYALGRSWGPDLTHYVHWIMLNPSTADAFEDDPTIRKCMGFARRWGYDGIAVTNLYAFRATSPKDLKRSGYIIGPRTDELIRHHLVGADRTIAAWGSNAEPRRAANVVRMAHDLGRQLHYLRMSEKTGQPGHPLYLPYELDPQRWIFDDGYDSP